MLERTVHALRAGFNRSSSSGGKVAAARTPLEADDSSAVEWFGAIRGEYRIGRDAGDLYFEKNGKAIATLLGGEARGHPQFAEKAATVWSVRPLEAPERF